MANDAVRPALTAEEWRLALLWHAGKMPGGKVRGMVVLSLPPDHQHGAAALALHGQPFGFTAEDVAALRDAYCPSAANANYDYEALADRLAALLPPEPV